MLSTGWPLLKLYNSNSLDIWKFFNRIWLNIAEDIWNKFPATDISNGKADDILEKAVDRILNWTLKGSYFMDPLDWITSSIKDNTQNIVGNQKSDDYNLNKVA